MHASSMEIAKKFVDTYLNKSIDLQILDVGSQDINGSYKELFNYDKWTYNGLDVTSGKNVDIVSTDLYHWPIEDNQYDVVLSGQCLEHVEAPWLWIKEIQRICKEWVCIIAPWQYKIHRYPIDCWRILPDGMMYLMTKWCNFTAIECGNSERDTYFIGKKYGK